MTTTDIEIREAALAFDDGNDEEAPTLLVTDDERYYVSETATGLTFRDDTPAEVWGPLTARLIRTHKRLEFALADAVNFGHRYGERYAQWVHQIGVPEKTLWNIAYVGRQVEPSRRREDISFSVHAEVAGLPTKMQDSILDLAAEHGWKQKRVREVVQVARAEIKQAEQDALPVPELLIPSCEIVVGDARALGLEDESVDLFCTSPPYALDKAYGELGDVQVDEWRNFMLACCRDWHRAAKVGARLVLNLPLDTTRPFPRPTYAQALFAAWRAGWSYRCTGIWIDDQLGKSTARGSVDSSSSPALIAPAEMILVMYKGDDWKRGTPDGCPSDVAHQDWLDWTNFVWRFPGESNAWESHPAPFPLELPRRVISILSFPGDLVVDPFVGSGTTALAAIRAGRRFYGCDREERYVASSKRRIEKGVSV